MAASYYNTCNVSPLDPCLPARWWSFEALIFMAGWFPDAQLAVATMGLCSMTNTVL